MPDDLIERLRDPLRPADRAEAAARIEALEAEIARLREALKPFADDADDAFDDTDAGDREISFTNVTVEDFRRARAALGVKENA